MACDWLAMSIQFKQQIREYYNKNKETFNLKWWQHDRIEEIYDCIEKYQAELI
jgi:predicted NUDIX family phosphoesterase